MAKVKPKRQVQVQDQDEDQKPLQSPENAPQAHPRGQA